jgi:hypothetical protein
MALTSTLVRIYEQDGQIEIDNNWCEPQRSGDSQPQAARRASVS